MRIAIANDGGSVSAHFGHCAEYTFFDIEDGKVVSQTSVPTPEHQPGILPPFLAEKGANVVIAGGMGGRAVDLFESFGVEVILGAQGRIDEVLQAYLDGTLVSGESSCSHSCD